MWDWWNETVDTVTEAVSDAWDWVNDTVDTYVWDTGSDEAVVESWVRNTFDIPDQVGKGFIEEAVEKVTEVVEPYVYQAGEAIEAVASWAYPQWYEPWLNTTVAVEDVADAYSIDWDEYSKDVSAATNKVTEDAKVAYQGAADAAGDYINTISLGLGYGFEAAMAVICGIPDFIIGLKTDLANWFTIDTDKLLGMFKDIQQEARTAAEEEEVSR